MKLLHNVLILFTFVCFTSGENILFFFGVSTFSHRILVWPLVEKLTENGHNVTFISPYRPKKLNPLVQEFCPEDIVEWGKTAEIIPDPIKVRKESYHPLNWFVLPDFSYSLCEMILRHPETKEWANKSDFDLIFIDSLFNDCGLGFVHKFKSPYILFGTSSVLMWMYESFGIPLESSWIPDMQFSYPQDMSLLERFHTTINPILWNLLRSFYVFPRLENLLRETLDMPDMPSLEELERNVSLIFINSHFSDEYARSLPPLVVSVGGLQIYDNNTNYLPKTLDDFIQKGNNGFIYVSFGSSVKISKTPQEFKDTLLTTFAKISSVQFVMKWDGEYPQEIPKNVFLYDWMPQQTLLAHPKIRGFISHAGELSIQESVYRGVPMIVLPCFAEQDYNAERVNRMEFGIRLEIVGLTNEQLENAITKLLHESKYSDNVKKISKLFKDRPAKPLDTAVWWTEYVLRHKDTSHLRPLSMYQPMYKRNLVDVWAIIFVILTAISYGIFRLVYKYSTSSYGRKNVMSTKLKTT